MDHVRNLRHGYLWSRFVRGAFAGDDALTQRHMLTNEYLRFAVCRKHPMQPYKGLLQAPSHPIPLSAGLTRLRRSVAGQPLTQTAKSRNCQTRYTHVVLATLLHLPTCSDVVFATFFCRRRFGDVVLATSFWPRADMFPMATTSFAGRFWGCKRFAVGAPTCFCGIFQELVCDVEGPMSLWPHMMCVEQCRAMV